MPGQPWSNEIELLLACARPQMREQDRVRAQAAAVADGVDWPTLVRLSDVHGLLPLLQRHLRDGVVEAPAEIRAAIHARANEIARRNLQLTAELVGILRDCAVAGIDVVPLKGPVLAEMAYGSLTLRRFGDLDLLVRSSDLPAMSALLMKRGYVVDPLPTAAEAFTLENGYHIGAVRAGAASARVELHYTLVTKRGRRMWTLDAMVDRLHARTFLNQPVRVLPLADEIIFLCEHGATHAWTRLEWIASVAELMNRAAVDWDQLGRQTVSGRARFRVIAAIDLAARLLDVHISHPLGPPPTRVRHANRAVEYRLGAEPARTITLLWESFRYQTLTDAGLAPALHRAWMTFAAPTPYDLDALPVRLRATPLKYTARPLGLLKRWYTRDRARLAARQQNMSYGYTESGRSRWRSVVRKQKG